MTETISTQFFARKLHGNEYFRRHIAHSTAQGCRKTGFVKKKMRER